MSLPNPEIAITSHDSSVTSAAALELERYLTDTKSSPERVLRDPQVTVMDDLYGFIKNNADDPRGYVSLPTGTGKTVLFTELVKATGLKTLVLTPTKLLLKQTSEAFNKFSEPDEEITVGHVYADQKKPEAVTVTTYASFVHQTENPEGVLKPGMFELIILDEAHRAMASATRRTLKKYAGAVQIGFTATEDYSEKRQLSTVLPHLIHKMSTVEAVHAGLIAPFHNVVVHTGIDASRVRITSTNEYDAQDLERTINNEGRNSMAVNLYKEYFSNKKVIIFCNGVEHSLTVARLFQEAGVQASAIHGGMSTQEQTEIKRRFHQKNGHSIDVLTNDRILTEGFDEPEIAAIMNLSPTLSSVRAKQRGGRALRLDSEAPLKRGYIIDFVDENYVKSPVLFADPTVAELAYVGDQNPSLFEDEAALTILKDSFGIDLKTDPTEVVTMASDYYESRTRKITYPPEGWINAAQLCALYGLRDDRLRQFVKTLSARQATNEDEGLVNHVHKYNVPHIPFRAKMEYYSPAFVELIARLAQVDFLDLEEGLPEEWLTWSQYGAHRDPRIMTTLRNHFKRHENLMILAHMIVIDEVEYIGPRAQRILDAHVLPPHDWFPLSNLWEKYRKTDKELEDLHEHVAGNFAGSEPIGWYEVEGNVTPFLAAKDYYRLRKELERLLVLQKRRAKAKRMAQKVLNERAPRQRRIVLPEIQTSNEELLINDSVYDIFGFGGIQAMSRQSVFNSETAGQIYRQDFSVNSGDGEKERFTR